MHHVQTVYLRLTNADASVSSVTDRIQEHLDSVEPIVVCDCKGIKITDCAGTSGKRCSLLLVCLITLC
ncbi:hypothetical protein DPMN_109054 [Dreissena polymorpha]|uniref:Uncharacterized protein n=1 Tax=Dreissena polymorpha TaxID=45954 RepID=A0A9D4QMM4_DREPO|nr:hypothetical protein DPMN_109054 [Dreissena polymorpha]